jgi:hypothetical protein
VRAAILFLLACAGGAQAQERSEPARFQVRAARVTTAVAASTPPGRFTVAGQRVALAGAKSPGARFDATAKVEVAAATCGTEAGTLLRDGFEG